MVLQPFQRVCFPTLQGPELAVHHGDRVLDGMNEWSREHHGASGLTARCRASTTSMQVWVKLHGHARLRHVP